MSKVSLARSFYCAFRGIFKGISQERSLKIHLTVGIMIIAISIILDISRIYLITIILVTFLVIILELFNKNFEKLIDFVSPEYNQEAGEIKDRMAGIVLATSLLALVVGCLILYQPVMRTLKSLAQSGLSLGLILLNITFIILILYFYNKRKNSIQNNSRVNNSPLYEGINV
jgi:diacylglycerol kinase